MTLLVLLEWYIAPRGAEQKQALAVTLAQILGGQQGILDRGLAADFRERDLPVVSWAAY